MCQSTNSESPRVQHDLQMLTEAQTKICRTILFNGIKNLVLLFGASHSLFDSDFYCAPHSLFDIDFDTICSEENLNVSAK